MVEAHLLSIASAVTVPLPLYTSMPVGRMTDDGGTNYDVVAGLTRELVEDLKRKSLDESDEALQQNTNDGILESKPISLGLISLTKYTQLIIALDKFKSEK